MEEVEMNTSNFSKAGYNEKAVSIAIGSPPWFKGRKYLQLAPSWDLVNFYKTTKDEVLYTSYYHREVLDKLNPEKVYNELGDDAILLCWESKNQFCHRRVVADWFLKHLEIEVPEL